MENFEINTQPNYSRNKKIVIIIWAVLMIVTAPAPEIFGENSSIAVASFYLTAIGSNFLVFAWCHYDSLERNQTLGIGWRVLIIFLGIFALLIYLYKSRGFKQGLISIGWTLLIFLGIVFVSALVATTADVIMAAK